MSEPAVRAASAPKTWTLNRPRCSPSSDGGVLLRTDRGHAVGADRTIQALGYEVPSPLRPDLVRLHSTYAMITEPVADFAGWDDRCLIWDRPGPIVSQDGLPYIGAWEGFRNRIFALGYGGNGITFGAIATGIIQDLCPGRDNDHAMIFRLNR